MDFNIKYLPRMDVVFTVMFLDRELCEKTLELVLGENIPLVDIVAEFKNDLHKAATNSIFFDVRTRSEDGRIITLDLQRKYSKERIRNRTVYYACREVSSQKIVKSKYEALSNVIVTFILTEASMYSTSKNSEIVLMNKETHEVYTELLTIHEVNIKHINNTEKIEMVILRNFFEIKDEKTFIHFVSSFGENPFAKLLLKHYENAISDPSLLDCLEKEVKFMVKLSEEDRLEERREGKLEGKLEGIQEGIEKGEKERAIKTAKAMLKDKLPIDKISSYTGLSEDEIRKLEDKTSPMNSF